MKKYIFLSIAVLTNMLALGAPEFGTLYVADATITLGQPATAAVILDTTNGVGDYVSFQMDLTLPEGITVNKADCSLGSLVNDPEQELVIGKQGENVYRLTSASFSLIPISEGVRGVLINLSLSASAENSGGQATLTNIRFVTANSNRMKLHDTAFKITVAKPAATIVTAPTPNTLTYTGSAQQLVSAGAASGGTMQYSLDGTSYSTNIPTGTNAGSYTVYYKVVGDANHNDSEAQSVSVTINAMSASNLTVSDVAAQTYTGSALTPDVVVKDGSATLTIGTHYTVSYSNNTNAGSASVTITGKGKYTGTQTVYFTINKAPLTITAKDQTITYGNPISTGLGQVSVTGLVGGQSLSAITLTASTSGITTNGSVIPSEAVVMGGSTDLTSNYSITYKEGNLTINAIDASGMVVYGIEAQTYTGLALTPNVTVKDGSTTLTIGTDYTVSYSNNINVGEATVTVKGIGHYAGTKTATFAINKAPLTVKAGSYTMKQGQALPTFVATYEGFVNGETPEVLTTKPTLTTTATSTSEPGEYEVTVGGAVAQNYEFSYEKGTLTVELLKGDVTCDGNVNAADVSALASFLVGRGELANPAAAYINDDNKIDIVDLTLLIGLVAKQ